jgi:DNA polymerase-4
MPLRVAYRKCPQAIFLPVDFDAYAASSRRIMAILRSYTSLVEPLSLDEAFLDVSTRPEPPRALADDIRQAITAQTGLTASIGIGPNKLLAKIASGLHKPDAVTEITLETAPQILRDLPATVLWGVGPKTGARLEATLGVRTVGDLERVPLPALQNLLGQRWGESLYRICRGEDESPIVTDWEPKSLSRETTYQYDVRRRDKVVDTIRALADDIAGELRAEGYRGRTIALKIRYYDFQTHTRAQTLPQPTDNSATIRQMAIALLDRFTLDRSVRLVGVRVSGLAKSASPTPQAPLSPPAVG